MNETLRTEQPMDCEQASVLAIDVARRRITHVISSGRLDRGNRIVDPAGWKLANFRKAPRVLADHHYSIERVIGKGHDLKVVDVPRIGQALIATTEFAKEGIGAIAFELIQAGLVNSWSVGWQGLESHRIGELEDCERCDEEKNVDYGRHFVTQELLEYSLVAIPANPDAVNGLLAAGLVSTSAADAWIALTTHAAGATKFERSAETNAAITNAATRIVDDQRRRVGLERWPGELSPHAKIGW